MRRKVTAKYRYKRKLGEGAFSKVLLVEDSQQEKEYALKVFKFNPEPKHIKMFKREARICNRLHYDLIAHVHEYTNYKSYPCLVMEYVKGEDLRVLLRKRKSLSIKDVVEISWKVCKALEYAHAHGVIHHDIKPANIMLTQSNGVKLTDFGFAKVASQSIGSLSTDNILASFNYASPEVFKNARGDPRSDLYSLGVVMFEMLTSQLPYETEDEFLLATQKMTGNEVTKKVSDVSSRVPQELERLVEMAMARHPPDRFQSASEMCLALERIAKREGMSLEVVKVPTKQHFKNMFLKWDPARIAEVVTEQVSNGVSWVLALIFALITFIVGRVWRADLPVSIKNTVDTRLLFVWIFLFLALVGIGVFWYRQRGYFRSISRDSWSVSILLLANSVTKSVLGVIRQRFGWFLLFVVSVTFFGLFAYYDFSKPLVVIFTILTVLTLLLTLATVYYELSQNYGNPKHLDISMMMAVFAIIFFSEFFFLQRENVGLTFFRREPAAVSETQQQEDVIDDAPPQTPQRRSDKLIDFSTGDKAAESTLWLVIILAGMAGMFSDDNPFRGLFLGAVVGGVLGSLLGPVVGAGVEFGKALPGIFPN